MTDTIEATLMRSGTSRGLYLLESDLPAESVARDRVLLAAMGSSSANQVDGVGGTVSVTNKIAIVSRSNDPQADIDYLFAQVDPGAQAVDYGPTCGNVLTGVAPFAIERGLVAIRDDETLVRVRLVNTGGRVEAKVMTPGGRVKYEGDTAIDGVPGSAAPVTVAFLDCVGTKTGALFPTGRARELVDAVPVTLVDAAMPTMVVRADALGKRGDETPAALDADADLFERIESMRREAGRRMGLGDVSASVIPKVAIVSPSRAGGTLTSRYLTPLRTHPSHAVTGGIAVAIAARAAGTVAAEVAAPAEGDSRNVTVEHPSGALELALSIDSREAGAPIVHSAGVVRTVRPIFTGRLYVAHAWTRPATPP